MSSFAKPVPGLRAPLFDRLVDGVPELEKEHSPLRVYGKAAVLRSIARDLDRLFNTRRHLIQPSDIDLPATSLTILDYGVPDFSWRSALDEDGRRRFADVLRTAIVRFESRLEDPLVLLAPDPENERQLLVTISGRLRLGLHAEPVTFSVVRHTSAGSYEVLAPTDAPLMPSPHGVNHG